MIMILKTMTRVLKEQGAQSNTSCVKVAEMEKEEAQGAKRLKVQQMVFRVLIGKLSFKSY